jgi:serine/threonine-protein kinase
VANPHGEVSDLPDDLAAALADRYRLDRPLGQGGMATVYEALDLKHHRKVAVKVLRAEVAATLGAERFLREIEIAAGLNHPHVLPLYDSGRTGGQVDGPSDRRTVGVLYYVMPLVEGESLRDRLNREKQLPIGDALRIAREVAEALSYAHSKGLVHRDIKPENILLESGHAVVTDFGIARAISRAASDDRGTLTDAGIAVGTPAYMSPEQAAGERELDGRSDLYSLACVLFEMLAGTAPFTGATTEVLIRQHIAAVPPPVTQFRPAVPGAVAEALAQALAKNPADRFNTVDRFAAALESHAAAVAVPSGRRPARRTMMTMGLGVVALLIAGWFAMRSTGGRGQRLVAGAQQPVHSIAVLPFANIGRDSAGGYVGDGVTEEILNALTQIPDLRVAARTSAFQFRGKQLDVREVGRQLDVGTVLEGSVQQAGDAIRITAQLIDARTGYHLWSAKFDRSMANLFAVEDEIARTIADTLKVSLGLAPRRSITADPVAHDLYLRGLALLPQRGAALHAAIACFDSALSRDSGFAPALAGLAQAYELLPTYNLAPLDSGLQAAEHAARRALALDSTLGPAWRGLANVLRDRTRWAEAEAAYRKAMTYAPNDPETVEQYTQLLTWTGQLDSALVWAERARRLDPLAPVPAGVEGLTLIYLHRYDSAAALFQRAQELGPNLALPRMWTMWNALSARRYAQAEWAAVRGAELAGQDPELYRRIIRGATHLSERAQGRALLARIPLDAPWEFNADQRPQWLLLLGDTTGALDATERFASQAVTSGVTRMRVWMPILDPIREHPRFKAALAKMGLPYRSGR